MWWENREAWELWSAVKTQWRTGVTGAEGFLYPCPAGLDYTAVYKVAKRKNKDNKYQYRANLNELIGILKDRLVFALIQNSPDKQAAIIDSILEQIKHYVTPVKSNRSIPRNKSPRNAKFHHNQKANC